MGTDRELPVAANEDYRRVSLPAGWVWATVGDIAESVNSGFPCGQHNQEGRGIPHLRPMNINFNGRIELSEVKYVEVPQWDPLLKGDVLFNNTNSPDLVGKTAHVQLDMRCGYSNHMTRIRLHEGSVDPAWVAYALHQLFRTGFFKMNCTNHVNQASINTQFLSRKVPIPVPPLPEQTRIVAQIEKQFSRLDAGTSALRRVQANLRRYRASVLKAACEGRLVPQDSNDEPASALLNRILAERRAKWEQDLLAKGKDPKSAKYVEPQVPDTDDLPELPVGWCWSSLPQLGELARGKSKHRPRDDARLYRGPYPFIQTGDVKNSRGRITTFTQTYSEFGLAQSRLWRAGTLCITIAANIADSGILTFDSCFPDSVVGFRVEPDHAEVRFIEFFMRVAKEDLEQYAPATAQKNINVAILEKLAIPLPPLAEQNRIVNEVERRLSVVDELESIVEHNLKRADRLRQSILKRAFEGKLVPQDPADEPADVLLERIRAQRQSAPTRSNMAKDSKQLQLPLLVSHSES